MESRDNALNPDKMKKMAGMYLEGMARDRDMKETIKWLHQFSHLMESKYERDRCETNAKNLLCALQVEGDANFRSSGRVPERIKTAGEAYQKMLPAAKWLSKQHACYETLFWLAACYYNIGDICMAEKNPAQAKENYQTGLNILDDIEITLQEAGGSKPKASLSPEELWVLWSKGYQKLGDVSKEEGDFVEAARNFQQAVNAAEMLELRSGNRPDCQMRLMSAYFHFGDFYAANHETEEGNAWYQKAESHLKEIEEGISAGKSEKAGMPEGKYMAELAYHLRESGDNAYHEGITAQALKRYEKAAELLERFTGKADQNRRAMELAACHEHMEVLRREPDAAQL